MVQTGEIAALTQEVSDLKETMMLSLLEKESATDRLKAVSLTSEMDHASVKVTDALFKTLNSDPSVNVRLAALEAIMPYAKSERFGKDLFARSLNKIAKYPGCPCRSHGTTAGKEICS
ncbi:MAG: hypothetical protein WDO15_18945 [Bacteroidota bacterium]